MLLRYWFKDYYLKQSIQEWTNNCVFWVVLCSYEHDSREYTLCKEDKSPSHIWAWSIKNLDYYLIRRYQRKILKDVKVLPYEACTTRHNSYVILKEGGKKTTRKYTKTVQRVISRHILTSTEQVLKNMLLLKVIKIF